MHRQDDANWQKLYEVLSAGVAAGHLICPIPFESALETSLCSPDKSDSIWTLLNALSLGIWFKSFDDLVNQETLALVRPDVNLCAMQANPDRITQIQNLRTVWNDVKNDKQRRLDEGELAIKNGQCQVTTNFRVLMDEISLSRCGDFYRNLISMRRQEPLNSSNRMTRGICAFLADQAITPEELHNLIEAVRHHKWESIPVLHYHALLSTQDSLAYSNGRPAKANDDVDRDRMAVSLHAADFCLTEACMAETCKQVHAANIAKSRVYAVRDCCDMTLALAASIAQRQSVVDGLLSASPPNA
jgi:hypothetical protein